MRALSMSEMYKRPKNRDANFSLSQWKRLQIKIDQENQRAGLSELSQGLRLM